MGPEAREGQAAANRPLFLGRAGHRGAARRSPTSTPSCGPAGAWPTSGAAWAGRRSAWRPAIRRRGSTASTSTSRRWSGRGRNAAEAGVADRVRFPWPTSATSAEAGEYDLVTAFECVHDLPDPVAVLTAMRALVRRRRDGRWWWTSGSRRRSPRPGTSVRAADVRLQPARAACPTAMSTRPSVATGTVMRPATLRGLRPGGRLPRRRGAAGGARLLPLLPAGPTDRRPEPERAETFMFSAVVAPSLGRSMRQRWGTTGPARRWRSPMSRSLWSDRPLGVKLAALVGGGRGSARGLRRRRRCRPCRAPARPPEELLASAEATEDVLLADMMHDAVRGDVLQALVSGGTGALYDGAVTDLAEHAAMFRADPRRGRRGDDLGAEVDAAVDGGHARRSRRTWPPRRRSSRWPASDPGAADGGLPAVRRRLRRARGRAAHGWATPSPPSARTAAAHSEDQRATAITLVAGRRRRRRAGARPARLGRHPLGRRARCTRSAPSWPGSPTGDLRGSTDVTSRDEVGRMAASLEASMANVRERHDGDRRQLHDAGLGHRAALGQRPGHGPAGRRVVASRAASWPRAAGQVSTQRADGRRRLRADGRLHPGDRAERQRGGPGGRAGGRPPRTRRRRPSPSWASPRSRSPAWSR